MNAVGFGSAASRSSQTVFSGFHIGGEGKSDPANSAREGGNMAWRNGVVQDESEFDGWLREADDTLRLWPMQSFSCGVISQGIPVMRIDFLYPPGQSIRAGTLQVHMSPQQARLLGVALLSAVRALE
jgi:hypothetical protein